MKKELVIVVPGLMYWKTSSNIIKKIEFLFYSLFQRRDPVFANYGAVWSKHLKKAGRETIWLHWGRALAPFSVRNGVKRLKRIIRKYRHTCNIKILGLSIGGEIALEAAREFDDGSIKKIVLLASVNENTKCTIKRIPITNIYSPQDIFLKVALKFFAPIHGGMKLKGRNVNNISIPNLNHDDFMGNRAIKSGKYKGKYILDVVNSEL